MEKRRVAVILAVVAFVILLAVGRASLAGPARQGGQAQGQVHVAGTVASRISYQGQLTDDAGNPLSGRYDLEFQLFTAAIAGMAASERNTFQDLEVTNGQFTVGLNVPAASFDGQELWLQIWADGTALEPRQPLLPVPYALGLRPGAVISSPGPAGLTASNSSGGYGLNGGSEGNIGVLGTSGAITAIPAGMHGVHGESTGVGVYGAGGHTGTYGSGDNQGVSGFSDAGVGVKGESLGGDGVVGLTSAEADAAGVRGRNLGSGPAVAAEGDLYVTGAYRGDLGPNGGAPFPRPAYDSGWVSIAKGRDVDLTHNLGGNVDNYVLDLQFKSSDGTIHVACFGGDYTTRGMIGGFWTELTASRVTIVRRENDECLPQARLRIWVYR